MFSFFKKRDGRKPQNNTSDSYQEELKIANENLYKHSFELAVKNKTLSLLGKLYEITIQDLDPKELVSNMVTEIKDDLSLELIAVYVFDNDKDHFSELSVKTSEKFEKALGQEGLDVSDVVFNASSENIFFKTAFDGNISNTANFADLFSDKVMKSKVSAVAGESHIKTTIAFPLKIKNELLGVWVISLNRIYDDLVVYEKESIRSIVNVIAVAIDKAQLYQKLRVTNENLEIANEGQSNLLHFITHQVKGYFTKSKYIFDELLGGHYGKFSKGAGEIISQGYTFANEGVDLVQNVLNAANIERGTIKYTTEVIDLKKPLGDVIRQKESSIKEKGLKLIKKIEKGDFKVSTDPIQIKEVFKNLIDNAIRYTPEGSITVGLSHNDGMIMFYVKDTGVGILEKDKEKLFKKGGKGTDSNKINAESTGYGLYIVKGIVEQTLGGRVWVESEGEGKGSTFFVQILHKR